ncbi:HEAT repeat domain-containing protein [Photobacterium sp. CAU 1568]|uniref:HEAT repeat domain-containing protein n=1 Tax=Photobacterium arenosum TaxID=2774143 RepID=A0ABR9BP54_9GAMM|nr:HEAT repeat domain-containing protein [Photobacterium arenosum]MBD8513367.1 HEAT repeat domain-containing protein [Photobacterium arenosum]
MSDDAAIQQLIEQLSDRVSGRRRSAAKKLRKLKTKEAGPALFAALKNELNDKRTWETQYQMIMALGESGYTESLDFLRQLAEQKFEATMIYVAIGDSITRLIYLDEKSVHNVIEQVLSLPQNSFFCNGILRAIAMQRIVPEERDIKRLLKFADSRGTSDNNTTWIVSASAGWHKNENTIPFLQKHADSENQQTKKAAEAALKKKYIKWSIL